MNIHYFQRYHQPENVATANLMLLLSRLYHYSSDIFYAVIGEFLGDREINEVEFQLQQKGKTSVPDAVIGQRSFKIVVETKLNNHFNKDQLLRHIDNFDSQDCKILLTVDPNFMNKNFKEDFEKELAEINKHINGGSIRHVNTTFEEIIKIIENHLEERDHDMHDILDDFRIYCFDDKLIDDSETWMRAIVTGTTYKSNLANNLYFDGYERGFSKHGYIGLYTNKSIKAIGKISKIACVYMDGDKPIFEPEEGGALTDEEKQRILQAIIDSQNYYGNWLSVHKHRYFLVDKFYETDFKKTTPYGIQRSKFFNLKKILGKSKLPNVEEIAKSLKGKTWETI